jgi:putative oxidoreductase
MLKVDAVWSERALGVLRIIMALLYLQHGTAKLLGFPHVAHFDNLQLFSLDGLAGVIEVVGSLLLLVGLFTRPIASSCQVKWPLHISWRMHRGVSFQC